jgi:hypothetical protein
MKKSDKSTDETAHSTQKNHPRLPCRGCLADCKLYNSCGGRLWRMNMDKQP